MNYELDGICVVCKRATPVSENTICPEGIKCGRCRRTCPDPALMREAQVRRLRQLEAERHRLLMALPPEYRPLRN